MPTSADLLQMLRQFNEQTSPSSSGSILQQYPGGQVLTQQQSVAEQSAAEQKAREAKAKADKAEADALASQKAAGYESSDFFKNTLGYSPNEIISSALTAANTPNNWGNIPSSDNISYGSAEPNTNASNSSALAQQDNSGFNIPAEVQQYASNTANVPTQSNAAPSTALTQNDPDTYNPNLHGRAAMMRSMSAKQKEQAKQDFLNTYALDQDGKIYKKNSKSAIHWDASTNNGRKLLEKAKEYGLSTPGAVQAAGNATQAQQATVTTNADPNQQGALANNAPAYSNADPNNATYKATPQELFAIDQAELAANKQAIGKPELDNMLNSIVSIKNNALEKLNSQATLVGGAQNLEYAMSHPTAGATQVAADLAAAWGLDGKANASIARKIHQLEGQYKNVPASVIGAVLQANSRDDADSEGFYENLIQGDTDLAGGMEYLDADVQDTLSKLNNRKAETSYERIKDTYNRTKNMMGKLVDVQSAIQMSEKAYNSHLKDLSQFGVNPEERLHQQWLKEDLENTNKYALVAAQKARQAFKELGGYYNAWDRVQYQQEAPNSSKSQANSSASTNTNTSQPASNSYLEKATGYGLYK
jgi:hypothetical protein